MDGELKQPYLSGLQRLILAHVVARNARFTHPVNSRDLAQAFNVCPSYAREQARQLVRHGLLEVRPGRKGGYYLSNRGTTGRALRSVLRPLRSRGIEEAVARP